MTESSPKKRVAVATLGCKVNQFESAAFLSSFAERDVEVVPFSQEADVYIVNTCAVTAKAGAQSRQMIRRALRKNPEARLVVTGCYAQIASQDILGIVDKNEGELIGVKKIASLKLQLDPLPTALSLSPSLKMAIIDDAIVCAAYTKWHHQLSPS